MEDFLVAEILEQLFKTFFRGLYKVISALSKFTVVILEPSVQDDRSTNFNGAFLECGSVSEMNLIYVAKR